MEKNKSKPREPQIKWLARLSLAGFLGFGVYAAVSYEEVGVEESSFAATVALSAFSGGTIGALVGGTIDMSQDTFKN